LIHFYFIFVPAAILLVALPLSVWAWRGRRIDDHPLCRKCGFDLFGKPVESARCSECGSDLIASRAIRMGHRRSHRRILIASAALGIPSGIWLGIIGFASLHGVDWQRHKPVAWLLSDARGANAASREAALNELTRRVSAGELSSDVEAELVESVLAHQADVRQPWIAGWGKMIESVRNAGRLNDKEWARYMVGAVALSLQMQEPTYRECDHFVRFSILRAPDRLGTPGLIDDPENRYVVGLYWDKADQGIRVDGQERSGYICWDQPDDIEFAFQADPRLPEEKDGYGGTKEPRPLTVAHLRPAGQSLARGFIRIDPAYLDRLTEGTKSLETRIILRPLLRDLRISRYPDDIWPTGGYAAFSPAVERKVDLRTTWDLVSTPIVTWNSALHNQAANSISPHRVQYEDGPGKTEIVIELNCNNAPTTLAYAGFIKVPDSEFRSLGGQYVYFAPGSSGRAVVRHGGDTRPANLWGKTVDVVLIPDPAAAPRGTSEILGGQIELKGIRIPDRPNEERDRTTQSK
jgi:hypothetical protein